MLDPGALGTGRAHAHLPLRARDAARSKQCSGRSDQCPHAWNRRGGETRASVLATIQAEVSDPRNHYYNRSRGLVVREIHYEHTWPTFPTIAEQDTFLVAWIALLESRELILGGEPTSDFICGYRKSPTLLTSTRFTSF